jgi:hypothetical protein
MEGIRYDMSRNLTRTISGWKVSMTRHIVLKMCVSNLLLYSIQDLLVELQQ